jgi:carboxypeptidase Taq
MFENSTLFINYKKLMKKYKKVVLLQSAMDLMNWDMETKMPPNGISLRSEQLAMLREYEHKLITHSDIGILLDKIEENPDYNIFIDQQKRNIKLIRKIFEEQTSLPEKLVVKIEKQRAITIDIWKRAKAKKDFSMFKPEIKKLVDLIKEKANLLKDVKQTITPYDALIDIYEPKTTSENISSIFQILKERLITLMDKCQSASKKPDVSILNRKIPINVQRKNIKSIARFIGYDVETNCAGGRIDETEHPFTSGYYGDIRITTHYYENKFVSSIFSVLHEGGHAIYSQNINKDWMFQPIGDSCSLGIHESQSRFLENMVGRSREFWFYFLPCLKAIKGNLISDTELDSFVFAINQVKPSKIRVEADEVSYCLHVIIRFEIERELIGNKIDVVDLPEMWNQKYKTYLNLKIENDSEGIMQDTHWASGLHGYFPTYALGNIYSGQILARLKKDIPDWKEQVARGTFQNVKNWLIMNIHKHGNLLDPLDLLKKATGKDVDVKDYLNYLNVKYSNLYGF